MVQIKLAYTLTHVTIFREVVYIYSFKLYGCQTLPLISRRLHFFFMVTQYPKEK